MTTRQDLEAQFYRAITGNRLGAATHTVGHAITELGRRFKQPWTVAGVSRETWRRWNLPAGAKNAQRPSAAKQAGLLAALRRLRLSDSREAKIRASTGLTVTAWDNYELIERVLGSSTFGWTQGETNRIINDVMDAYLVRGVGAAVDAWLRAAPADGGWAQEWLHPDAHGSMQSMDIRGLDLTGDPGRPGRRGRARRR